MKDKVRLGSQESGAATGGFQKIAGEFKVTPNLVLNGIESILSKYPDKPMPAKLVRNALEKIENGGAPIHKAIVREFKPHLESRLKDGSLTRTELVQAALEGIDGKIAKVPATREAEAKASDMLARMGVSDPDKSLSRGVAQTATAISQIYERKLEDGGPKVDAAQRQTQPEPRIAPLPGI